MLSIIIIKIAIHISIKKDDIPLFHLQLCLSTPKALNEIHKTSYTNS